MRGDSFRRRLERQLRGIRNQIAAQENEAAAQHEQDRHSPPFVNRIVSTPANGAGSSEAPQADKPKGEAGHTASETALVRATQRLRDFTLALVLVSLISAVISYLQWQEIHDGSADTHVLAQAAENQAKAVTANAKTAQDALVNSQRSWVGTTDASVIVGNPGSIISGNILYVNSGREPARVEMMHGEFVYSADNWDNGNAVADISRNEAACRQKSTISVNRYAWPTTGFNAYSLRFGTGKIPQFGVAVWNDDIAAGRSIVTVQGCITYETVKTLHHTTFCYYFKAKDTEPIHLGICDFGNYAD